MAVIAYLVLSFGYSWGVFAFAYARGAFHGSVGIAEFPYLVAYMCGPAIAALILGIATRKEMPIAQRLGLRIRPNLWWLFAWLAPIAVCFAAVALDGLLGFKLLGPAGAAGQLAEAAKAAGAKKVPPVNGPLLFYLAFAGAAVPGSFINMFATLTEELGWRGFLWSKLRPFGFWRTSLGVGAVWGLWHAPIIFEGYNYPGATWRGVLMMTLLCTLYGPIIGLARERGRSVLAAGLAHGTLNAVAGVSLLLLVSPPVFWRGILGWAGMAVLAAADLLIALTYRPAKTDTAPG